MKKFLIAMAAGSVLSLGAPAAAQYAGGSVQAQLQQLELRLQAGIRSRAISRGEAIGLREQLASIRRLERQYGQAGLSRRELADLQQRIQAARQRLSYAERNADNRYDRNRDGADDRYDRNADGRDDRYDRNRDGADDRFDRDADGDDDRFDRNDDDRDDRFDRNRDGDDDRFDRDNDGDDDRFDRDDDDVDDRYDRLDANRDGRDDRDLDRDGRWEEDRDGVRGERGVVESVIDGATGGATLRVGQRAAADLGAVPYAYRGQYRDGDGAYYRSDGRAIYQIDARTNLVVRVYPMNR